MTDVYLDALKRGASATGIALDDDVAERMAAHHALVVKWAKKINLTTVTDPERAASLHGVDSLLYTTVIEDDGPTIDVGSGGGFPGVALALVRPAMPIVLLEPIRKRCSFLRTVLAELGIDNARVVEGKLEADSLPPRVDPPARFVSRATIPPLELVPLAMTHLSPEGTLVLSGGAGAPSVEALEAAGGHHVRRATYTLPTGEPRVIDVLRP